VPSRMSKLATKYYEPCCPNTYIPYILVVTILPNDAITPYLSIPSGHKKFALNSQLRVLWNARPIVSAISPIPFALSMPSFYMLGVSSGGYQLRKFSTDPGCHWSSSLFMWHFYFRQYGLHYFHVFHQTCFLIKQS